MGPIVLRRPEYTGQNRCWPCTVANGLVLAGCCLALVPLSIPLSLFALLAGAGAIRYRGYLVPYTPQLTARVRQAIASEPARPRAGSLDLKDDEELGRRTVETLLAEGVLVPDGDRLHLEERFRGAWREEMTRLRARSDEGLLAAITAATDGTDVELLEADRPLFVLTGSVGGEAWVSRPVVIAEIAAERALGVCVPDMNRRDRLTAARALRSFLEYCPVCETPTEETRPHLCCGSAPTPEARSGTVLVCPACDEALYRFLDD
ncbi:hypothetical protein [Halalkalicoccus jeotgali]|uniref:Uncharacterized protein n=1 Tax=Halalkalicoccus jeotgali (strain DSM 18796 / CECT 7217 / JCM 14584 / KCTC 4019 / B3) TaxID=795797 RepID=D8JAV0_HALJB|nr:hypothetical protein [Halalkalicoccus jeotgali]ADJ14822.1 hypothetical protein HacjB3_07175 [Halalkalicoccus jeotgali B3]ELY39405.1 hypothetical protein C497_05587 [Halalkalicoccus jeotgali B3]